MKRLLIVVVLILIIVVVIGWIGLKLFVIPPKLHAVYLITGDFYFGKLVRFPSFGLKQVYTIQVNPQDQETPFSIQRFRNIFWGPKDFIKINRENVVWIAGLDPNGQFAQVLLNNPDLLPAQLPLPNDIGLPAVTTPPTGVIPQATE